MFRQQQALDPRAVLCRQMNGLFFLIIYQRIKKLVRLSPLTWKKGFSFFKMKGARINNQNIKPLCYHTI